MSFYIYKFLLTIVFLSINTIICYIIDEHYSRLIVHPCCNRSYDLNFTNQEFQIILNLNSSRLIICLSLIILVCANIIEFQL